MPLRHEYGLIDLPPSNYRAVRNAKDLVPVFERVEHQAVLFL